MKLKKEEMKENYLKTLEKMGENREGGGGKTPPPQTNKRKKKKILKNSPL